MANKLRTSEKTEEILTRLDRAIDLGYTPLARLCFAVSLIKNGPDVSESKNARGKEFNKYSLIGEYGDFYRSLLSMVYNKRIEGDKFYSNTSLFKNHIDAGALILNKIYKSTSKDPDEFLADLSSLVQSQVQQETIGIVKEVRALDIEVGEKLNGEEVVFGFNQETNPHMGIMGTTGCGKTQFLLNVLYDIRKKSEHQTSFIFFDYKGEFLDQNGEPASNLMEKFINNTGAEVHQLPTNTIPINPFLLNSYGEKDIKLSAEDKANSFSSITGRFGEVQKGNLVRAIVKAYEHRRENKLKYPDLREVYSIIQANYEEENKKEDTLTEVMRQLSEFDLFWSHGSKKEPIRNLTERTLIIDLSRLPERLRELVAYLVIEQLYREMSRLPDSKVEGDYRQIRTCLVIDEAHHYLPQKNIFLQRIIREGRSKGVAVFLASQSPKDYSQRFFNFGEFLEFPVIMKSKGASKKVLQSLLGISNKKVKELKQRLPNFDNFKIITRPQKLEDEYLECSGKAFFERFG